MQEAGGAQLKGKPVHQMKRSSIPTQAGSTESETELARRAVLRAKSQEWGKVRLPLSQCRRGNTRAKKLRLLGFMGHPSVQHLSRLPGVLPRGPAPAWPTVTGQ